MKKIAFLLLAIITVGGFFHSCDNSKTYAEMLEDERKAVNDFIKKNGITVISVEEFEKDTITDVSKNEYVSFSNGVYMQIVKRYGNDPSEDTYYESFQDAPEFENNNLILARFTEVDIISNDTTSASNVSNPIQLLNIYPDGFRYTDNGYSVYGQFVSEPGLALYYGFGMGGAYDTNVPAGWLMALQYIRDGAHVKLIVPSKNGHSIAQNYVYPYFYDIREFYIY